MGKTLLSHFLVKYVLHLSAVFFFFFFLFGFYGPFKNISHIEPIVYQRWAKTSEPGGKNHLTIRKQNLAFPHDLRVFVCVEVLWPSQPNGVMLSEVSLPNYMFTV